MGEKVRGGIKMLVKDENGKDLYIFTPTQYRTVKANQAYPHLVLHHSEPVYSTPHQCEYCGSIILGGAINCRNCGAPVPLRGRMKFIEMLNGIQVKVVSEEEYKRLEEEQDGTER